MSGLGNIPPFTTLTTAGLISSKSLNAITWLTLPPTVNMLTKKISFPFLFLTNVKHTNNNAPPKSAVPVDKLPVLGNKLFFLYTK